MFLLKGDGPVTTPADLQRRLTAGLVESVSLTRAKPRIEVNGQWPALAGVSLDLTGTQADTQRPPPRPDQAVEIERRFTAEKLEVLARPLYLGSTAQVELELGAARVEMAVLRDGQGMRWLALTRAGQASVNIELGELELERLFVEIAGHLAASHGVKIEAGRLHLKQLEADTLRLETTVAVRKAFLKGTVTLTGQARLDRSLDLHLTGVTCSGHGVIGALAAPLLQARLEGCDAEPVPLLGHTFSELQCERLRLELKPGGALHIEAILGS